MEIKQFDRENEDIIIHGDGKICTPIKELLYSDACEDIINRFIDNLHNQDSPLLNSIAFEMKTEEGLDQLIRLLQTLCEYPLEQVANLIPQANFFLQKSQRKNLCKFVEELNDFWHSFREN